VPIPPRLTEYDDAALPAEPELTGPAPSPPFAPPGVPALPLVLPPFAVEEELVFEAPPSFPALPLAPQLALAGKAAPPFPPAPTAIPITCPGLTVIPDCAFAPPPPAPLLPFPALLPLRPPPPPPTARTAILVLPAGMV
jgi:hypothetical protein